MMYPCGNGAWVGGAAIFTQVRLDYPEAGWVTIRHDDGRREWMCMVCA